MRRHFSNYFKGLPHFKETRLRLLTSVEEDDIREIINGIKLQWGDFRTDDTTSVYDM
jgi:tRNA-dihydrouridine synthase B